MKLANWLNTPQPIFPSLHPSPERTWICLIVVYLSSEHPIPSSFIYLQNVRELDQLFNDTSSNPIRSSTSVSSLYANLINCLNSYHLIIPSLPLHPYPERTWIWLIVEYISSDYPTPSLLYPSPECTRTCSIFFWDPLTDHPLIPSPGSTWFGSIDYKTLIWTSHPLLFIRLQSVCELVQFLRSLIQSSHAILVIRLQNVCELGSNVLTNNTIPSSSSVSRKYVN